MDNAAVITQDSKTRRPPISKLKSAAVYLLWGGLLIFRGIAGLKTDSSHASQHFVVAAYPLIGLGLLLCLAGLFLLFGMASIGSVSYEEVADLGIEQRVRTRYASEINQLTSLGFSYAFTSGEWRSVFRMLRIFPVVISLQMRANGAVMALRGSKTVAAAPLLSSADGRIFARSGSLGVTFYTAFRNGQILVTKNYELLSGETPGCMMQSSKCTIAEAWETHKERLNKMETEANPALRDRSYAAYADIARREDVFIKSQN